MASYGPIYEFAFDSQNGADILIVISKKNYTGEVTRRPLGRAPILKRENNENIYGTSLEIYAECKVDGEYAEFYTSSADEFMVDVYKDQVSIWTGFITPELYSEPDIAPPYDVQIIATDGLGELRDLTFYSNETKSVYEHIKSMLDAMNATRLYGIISDLKYVSGDFVSGAAGLFGMRVNLEHEIGNNCYDVLQNILRSINASMTLYGDSWLIFRKTDFIRLAEEDWVHGAYSNGHETLYPVAEFGSMDKTNWWPIGQMSSVIEPAKKSVVFQAPNHYKRNALSDAWVISDSTSYDNIQKAYTLSSKDAYITQHIDFGAEIGYALSLKIKAMNVGAPIFDIKKGNYIDQGIGVRVKVVDEDGHPMYLESLDSDRGIGSYHWVSDESTWIEGDLALPALSDRKSDAQEVEIIIPLYVSTPMSKALATSMDVTVFNIDGTYPINIYNISLGAHEKAPGYEANVVLNNNAREEGDSVETTFSDAYRLANAGYIFMSGIPMLPYQDVAIGSWQINDGEARDYVTTMAEDYAMQSALPRMSYRGVLNVPRANLPVLFLRDGTYYFPRTYSYNLYDDELEVELISVPAADVEVSSIVISEYTPSYGASSGSSGGGSGIGGSIDLSGYAKKEEVKTLSELLASMWTIDEETGDLITDRNVRIAKNVIIGGDTSTGGTGQDVPSGIDEAQLKEYLDTNKYITSDYAYSKEEVNRLIDEVNAGDIDLTNYYTKEETASEISKAIAGIDIPSLDGYAKLTDIPSLDGYAKLTDIPATMAWTAITGKPSFASVATSGSYNDLSNKPTIPTTLPASDVYAWAKAATKPSYKTSEVAEETNLYFTNARAVSALADTLKDYVTKTALASDLGEYASKEWVNEKGYITGITLTGDDYISVNGYKLSLAIDAQGGLTNTGQGLGIYQIPSAKIVTDALGYTPANNASLADYLPKSGGTMKDAATIKWGSNKCSWDGVPEGFIGMSTLREDAAYNYYAGLSFKGYYGFQIRNYAGTDIYEVRGHNSNTWGTWRTLIHSGNIGSQTVAAANELRSSNGAVGATVYSTGALLVNNAGIYTQDASYQLLRFDGTALNVGYSMRKFNPTIIHGNTIQFNIGDASKMLINSSGNVTIGGSDLAGTDYKLYVNGTSEADSLYVKGYIRLNAGGIRARNGYGIDWVDSNNHIHAGIMGYNNEFSLATNNTEALRIKSNGNVGIGTPSPSYKLHVNGDIRGNVLYGTTLYAATGSDGIYVTGSGIYYHNSSNQWVKDLVAFASDGSSSFKGAVTMSSTLSVGSTIHSKHHQFVTENYSTNTGNGRIGCFDFPYSVSVQIGGNGKTENDREFCFRILNNVWNKDLFHVGNSGKVGIGTETPQAKLHVNGDLIVAGDTSTGSDIRFKDKLSDHRIALSDIAEAPLFTFKWNDREDKTEHLGSSAQYWEKVAPWLVKGEDFKTLDYSTLGVAIGISLANKAVNHEERIKILEGKVKALEAKNRRLRYGC